MVRHRDYFLVLNRVGETVGYISTQTNNPTSRTRLELAGVPIQIVRYQLNRRMLRVRNAVRETYWML